MRVSTNYMFLAVILLILSDSAAFADIRSIDYPHNSDGGYTCWTCHYYTASPAAWAQEHTPTDIDDTPYNNLCYSCHNDVYALDVSTHSSLQTSNKYGDWTVECRKCHWVHHQQQSRAYGASSYVYTTTANASGNNLTRTGGAAWTVDEYAGYIVIPNINQRSYNYNILSNTTDTLTIDGPIDPTKFTNGNTMAIIYGNMVKNTIRTPNSGKKTVKFFDKTGANSFAYDESEDTTDPTPTGVCQVCHTRTTHWRNDGTLSAIGLHATKNGENCIDCHDHTDGFKGSGHDDTHFSWDTVGGVTCQDCHTATNVESVHSECANCHDTATGITRDTNKIGDATFGIDGNATLAPAEGVADAAEADPDNYTVLWGAPSCSSCHPVATYDISTTHHESRNNYADDGDCTQCHGTAGYKGDHANLVKLEASANCTDCHNGTKGGADNVPVGSGDNKLHDSCLTCHNADDDGTLKLLAEANVVGTTATVTAMPNPLTTTNDGGGVCSACHGVNLFINAEPPNYHNYADHSATVVSYANCVTCHTATHAPAGGGPVPLDSGNVQKHDLCATCHETSNGRLKAAGSLPLVTAMPTGGTNGGVDGGGDCSDCHDEYFSSHTERQGGGNHTGITTTASCLVCHTGTGQNLITGVHDLNTSGNSCASCHNITTGARLDGTAAGSPQGLTVVGDATVNSGNGGTCETCHTGSGFASTFVNGHVDVSTKHNKVSADASCSWCHGGGFATWSDIEDVHDVATNGAGACKTCHNDADADVVNAIGNGKSVAMDGSNSAVTCQTCHTGANTVAGHGVTAATVGGVHNLSSDSSNVYDCESCHTFADGAAQLTRHMVNGNTTANCLNCHTAADAASGASATGVITTHTAPATNTAANCEECHAAKGDYTLHGILPTGDQANGIENSNGPNSTSGLGTHDKLGASSAGFPSAFTDCENCHVFSTSLTKLNLHLSPVSGDSNTCLTCHTAGGTAATAITNGYGGATQYCATCHAADADYTFHGVTLAEVANEHNNYSSSNAGATEANCANCHITATAQNRLDLHTNCLYCHDPDDNINTGDGYVTTPATAGTSSYSIIAAGWSHNGGATLQYCESCHSATDNYSLHGLTIGTAAADHGNYSSSSGAGEADCANCHTAATVNNRLDLHPACSTCHDNSVGAPATTAISSGRETDHHVGGGGTTAVNCEDCHTAQNQYNLHGMTAATVAADHGNYTGSNAGVSESNCNNCHLNTTAQNRIELHLACSTCHTTHATTWSAGSSEYSRTTVINNGREADGNHVGNGGATMKNCEDCHTAQNEFRLHGLTIATVVADHENYSVSSGAGEADCSNCHITTTTTNRMDLHPACSTCHTAAGAAVTTINGGRELDHVLAGAGNTVQNCEDCHTGADVYNLHGMTAATVAADHGNYTGSNAGVSESNCNNCHLNTTAQNRIELHLACSTCHTTHATTWSAGSSEYSRTTVINNGREADGNHVGNGGATMKNCEDCHTAQNEFRLHGLTIATVQADHTNYTGSNAGATEANCGNCHIAATRTNRMDLHPACSTCHTAAGAAVTTINGGRELDHVLAGAGNTVQNCEDCHTAETVYNLHGMTAATVAADHGNYTGSNAGVSESNCNNCHLNTTAQNRIELHAACSTCHTTHASDGSNETAVINNGREADGNHVGNGGNTTKNCEDCHTAQNVNRLHGLTTATVESDHDNYSVSTHTEERDCANCHTIVTATQRINLHAACSTCHTTHASDGTTRTTVINAGRETLHHVGSGGTTAANCESCHTGKGVYALHGLSDDNTDTGNGTNDTAVDVHDNFNDSSGQDAVYTGKLAGVYGGLQVSTYNCADCHSSDRTTITDEEFMKVHTRIDGVTPGVGYGDCRTCHNANGIKDEVTNGRHDRADTSTPVAGLGNNQAIECETCHTAAYDSNSPSGNVMYQYDGARHHTTSNAQNGNCTYCHADPRPATPTLATGYASTADYSGTYDTGWATDYGITPATIPKQPACSLCHTNSFGATSFSVEVYGGNGNHGYNISYGTQAQRETGLTVWADDYQPGWPTVPDDGSISITADPVTQSLIHRIEPNSGTGLIQAYNLGACLGCHSVQLRHASPIRGSDYTTDVNATNHSPYDVLRYSSGRSIFGTGKELSGNQSATESWKDHDWEYKTFQSTAGEDRGNPGVLKGVSQGEDPKEWGSGVTGDTLLQVPSHSSFNNFETLTGMPTDGTKNADADIYYFADIAAPATTDGIHITKAYYNGSTIEVHAYSNIGSGQTISFTYTGGGCGTTTINWVTDHYEGTCNTPSGWTDYSDTVTVSNTTTTSVLDVETSLVDGITPAAAAADSYGANPSAATSLAVMANDSGDNIYLFSIDDTSLDDNCKVPTPPVINGSNIDVTCGATLGAAGTFDYTIKDQYGGSSSATVTVAVDPVPTLSISQPDGDSDSVFLGDSYDITYNLDDNGTVTVDFYYDSDNSGLDGVAITGACADAVEGTGVTCAWDTTGMAQGSYYVYGVTSDAYGSVSAYSPGMVSITPAPFSDFTEDFAGTSAGATAVFANGWTADTDSGGASSHCWLTDTNATGTNGTGITVGNPQPYVYRESSTNGGQECGSFSGGDNFWMESPDLDAGTYTFTLSFDYNYESTATSNFDTLAVYYRNSSGGSWIKLQDIITSRLGATAAWASTGALDLSGVLNQANSRVRIQVLSGGGTGTHDVTVDNITINGTP